MISITIISAVITGIDVISLPTRLTFVLQFVTHVYFRIWVFIFLLSLHESVYVIALKSLLFVLMLYVIVNVRIYVLLFLPSFPHRQYITLTPKLAFVSPLKLVFILDSYFSYFYFHTHSWHFMCHYWNTWLYQILLSPIPIFFPTITTKLCNFVYPHSTHVDFRTGFSCSLVSVIINRISYINNNIIAAKTDLCFALVTQVYSRICFVCVSHH